MHRFFAPVALHTVTDAAYPILKEQLIAAEVSRVILCGVGEIKTGGGTLYENPALLEKAIRRFQQDGFEVCVWVNALGHGGVLSHSAPEEEREGAFRPIVGLNGGSSAQGLCPSDEGLRAHFAKSLQIVAAMHPDLIMLDDDFRLNVRDTTYDIGCFCDWHMEQLCRCLGETVTREELYEKAFTGGENRYRSAWMDLMAESLLGFAREMRAAVDAVDPKVRLSACMCSDTWDMDGTDGMELARAFAGSTKPFLRTFGAPYHERRIAAAVENTRMQAAWCRDSGIEISAEGDVYPRPRYMVPAAQLELYDLALVATGAVDADQKYMFDYVRRVGYENGYVERHVKNGALRRRIEAAFAGKRPVGVQAVEVMHKTRTWDLPREKFAPVGRYIHKGFAVHGARILAENGIPTAYETGDGPLIVFGENARHVGLTELARGAVLDATAARILTQRGVDVGLLATAPGSFSWEYYVAEDDLARGIGALPLARMTVAAGAQIETLLQPGDAVGSYRYENANGQRFFVLALDSYGALPLTVGEYHNNYYRARQLEKALEWVAKKPLPAACTGHPYLYLICCDSADGRSRAVLLLNVFEDAVLAPTVALDRSFAEIKMINGTGTLQGNAVVLDEIPAYGVAAFEVKM
ncbi:MAG: hypothetical protein IJY50_01390 [Clostridia bacterium]|nr:hypothetical protein [Clostridia bacterium]